MYTYRLLATYDTVGQHMNPFTTDQRTQPFTPFEGLLHVSLYSESTAGNISADGLEFSVNGHPPVHVHGHLSSRDQPSLPELFSTTPLTSTSLTTPGAIREDHTHRSSLLKIKRHVAADQYWVSLATTIDTTPHWTIHLSPAQSRHLRDIVTTPSRFKFDPKARAKTFDRVHADGRTTTIDSQVMER